MLKFGCWVSCPGAGGSERPGNGVGTLQSSAGTRPQVPTGALCISCAAPSSSGEIERLQKQEDGNLGSVENEQQKVLLFLPCSLKRFRFDIPFPLTL